MKQITKIIETNISKFGILILLISLGSLTSCEDLTLPEAGSIPDLTPPAADFSYTSSTSDFKTILFTNLSTSASEFSWDFSDGGTSTDKEPSYTFAGGEGTYPVKLISRDGNGVTAEVTIDVVVVDLLIPVFECPSFECSSRRVWSGDGRTGSTSTYSGSGSPTPPDGTTGAKVGANSTSQFLDQTIIVTPGTNYTVSFWFVSKSGGTAAGNLLIEDADDNTVLLQQAVPLSASSSAYEPITYNISTTATTTNLRFFMTAGDVETRFDLVEIKKI